MHAIVDDSYFEEVQLMTYRTRLPKELPELMDIKGLFLNDGLKSIAMTSSAAFPFEKAEISA